MAQLGFCVMWTLDNVFPCDGTRTLALHPLEEVLPLTMCASPMKAAVRVLLHVCSLTSPLIGGTNFIFHARIIVSGRQYTIDRTDVTGVNVMLDVKDATKHLKLAPGGLEARNDALRYRCHLLVLGEPDPIDRRALVASDRRDGRRVSRAAVPPSFGEPLHPHVGGGGADRLRTCLRCGRWFYYYYYAALRVYARRAAHRGRGCGTTR